MISSACAALIDKGKDFIVPALDTDHDFIKSMGLDFANLFDAFVLKIRNDGIRGNPCLRVIGPHEIPDSNLLFRAESKGITAGRPDFLASGHFSFASLRSASIWDKGATIKGVS